MRTKYKIRPIFHTCLKSRHLSQNKGFYKALDALKQEQKRKDSQITLFIENNFYNEAQEVLKVQTQTKQNLLSGKEQDSKGRNGPIMKVKSKPAIKNCGPQESTIQCFDFSSHTNIAEADKK